MFRLGAVGPLLCRVRRAESLRGRLSSASIRAATLPARRHASTVGPVNPGAMNLRWHLSHARGYLALGMLKEAQAELAAIPPPDADRFEVHALRVALLHDKEDWRALRRLAADLVKRQPDEAGWWVSFAFATRRLTSIEKARAILLEAESHHPSEATIQFNLACYSCQLGDLDEGRRRLERAIKLDDKFREHARTDPDLAPLRAADATGLT
jgi:hypothetical protein